MRQVRGAHAASGASNLHAADEGPAVRSSVAAADATFRKIVARAAARFRSAGRGPYYFARGKLSGDPVFAALLRDGRIAAGARIVDVGCGLGVLAALLVAAEECEARAASEWPAGWPPAPRRWTLHGFDLRERAIANAQRALTDVADRVELAVADMRTAPLPQCDLMFMLDVAHYIDRDAQRALFRRAEEALVPGGTLLIRVGDAVPGVRFYLTMIGDWVTILARGTPWPRLHFRSVAEWIAMLQDTGFVVSSQPMSQGTPFANVLLIAHKPKVAQPLAVAFESG